MNVRAFKQYTHEKLPSNYSSTETLNVEERNERTVIVPFFNFRFT